MYLGGCIGHRSSYAANTGFTALEAMGVANLMTFGIKVAAKRQYAYHSNPRVNFGKAEGRFRRDMRRAALRSQA